MNGSSSGQWSIRLAATSGLVGLILWPGLLSLPSAWSLSSMGLLPFAIPATVWAGLVVAWAWLLVARAERDARVLAEEEHQEMADVVEHLLRDRNGFLTIVDDNDRLVEVVLRCDCPPIDVEQALQTFTSNAAWLGLTSVVTAAHALADRIADGDGIETRHIKALGSAWQKARVRLGRLVGAGGGAATVVLSEREHDAFLEAITAGVPRAQLAEVANAWRYDTGALVLERVGDVAVALSRRHGKEVDVVVNDDGLRFASATWAPLWSTIVQAVKHVVDHGLALPAERMANAMAARAQLTIEARLDPHFDELIVVVRDNRLLGDGVAGWNTETGCSGPGVGLGALRKACADLGGTIKVRNGSSEGMVVEVRVPHPQHVVRTIELIDSEPGINVTSPSRLAH